MADSPALPSKTECFQSSLTGKGHRSIKNVGEGTQCVIAAYQVELQEEMTTSPSAAMWEEVFVVTVPMPTLVCRAGLG